MQIVHTLDDLHRALTSATQRVLVPTMGNLHEGHLDLMRMARRRADQPGAMTVASIFVNRLQFAPNEDFDSYPRTLERDCELLAAHGCDLVFAPRESDLYPEPQTFKVHPPAELADILEGAFRPGFFLGVCTVVHKLFNCVRPDIAVFGKKDYQQLMVIRNMVRQMTLPIEIIGCETRRDHDGLALSSRNGYLSTAERAQAAYLSQTLHEFAVKVRRGNAIGQLNPQMLEELAMQAMQARGWKPDYMTVRRQRDLSPIQGTCSDPLVVLGAARLGSTRLIDNLEL